MLSKVWSAATLGIDAVRITIEVDAAQAAQRIPGPGDLIADLYIGPIA